MTSAQRSVERLRLVGISLALTLGMVAQDAGRTAADTKLDLVVDPARFLSQAVSMWDPLGEGGRLQNQAYGYLFPMGPFFAVARWLDIPPWLTQRLWESALLVAAFLGMYCVTRALGAVQFWPAVGAGLVYALTPRVLAEITSNSAELLPTMVLPWMLLPLIRGAQRGSPRTAAALSGIALLFAGGTNAGATLAILPIPLLWLVTRAGGPRRSALLRWSGVSLLLATSWWVVPLLVLGRYSPPFLDWIEAAENTTVSTSLFAALRGAPHWVTYLGPSWWPAGWIYVANPAVVAATAAVAAVGLAGLSLRQTPHRLFLGSCLGLGLVAVTFGHGASVGPVLDGAARTLLDGPLVAFRNVHKFQPLITMPLAVGFGCALARVRLRDQSRESDKAGLRTLATRFALVVAALGIGGLAVAPALDNQLVSAARDESVAGWWRGAARWLAAHTEGSRALIVPGAPFPTYLWGETVDEAMQPVAETPWVVRSAIPLAQPGLIRLLDVIEGRLASGRSDPSLALLLARSGIGYVVVRHDLDSIASSAVPQSLVRSTLEASAGFQRMASLGPRIGEAGGRTWLVDGGAGGPRPAIEIYSVAPGPGRVAMLSAAGTVRSTGSSDMLASLMDGGLSVTTPVVFGADGRDIDLGATVAVATDGVRRQQDSFGGPFRRSRTLSATEPFEGDRRVFDFLPTGVSALSAFRLIGVADVLVSSSGADIRTVFNANPAYGPWSALDADPASAWRSASWYGALGQWIEVRFVEPIDVGSITVAFAPGSQPFPTSVEVTTDDASSTVSVRPDAEDQQVNAPSGETKTLRLTVRAVEGGGLGTSVGIANLDIAGVLPERTLDVPDVGTPSVLRFAVAPGYRSDCLAVSAGVVCDPAWARRSEESDALDRTFTLTESQSYAASATVRLVPGAALDRLLDVDVPVQAGATSVDSADPRVRAGAAVDSDTETAWVADADDETPQLSLDLGSERLVRALRIVVDGRAPIARPTTIWIQAGDQGWIGQLPPDGLIRLAWPAWTDTVRITIVESERRQSISMRDRSVLPVPVGISEVRLDPALPSASAGTTIEIGCDSGLEMVIDGTAFPLAVSADRSDVLAGAPVTATLCDRASVRLQHGEHRFALAATRWAAPVAITLSTADLSAVHRTPGEPIVDHWGTTRRRVRVDADSRSILVVHENFNDGWTAHIDGRALESVRIDGWQQGFVVPSGVAGVIELTYAPQRAVVAGLLVGAAGVPALLALAFVRPRRTQPDPIGERLIGAPLAIVLALLVGFVLTGVIGLVAIIATFAIGGPLLGRASSSVAAIGGPALLATAGLVVAGAASATSMIARARSPSVQMLCVVAVAITLVAGLPRQGRDP